jgi:6-pyruvoyltetrahydropterin/6-carboxytetrahydropterin synthase
MGTQLALDNGELRVPIVSSYLHGYAVSFRVWFEGDLDHRNWVFDFGGMKRAKGTIDGMDPKAWMDYMFDHTTVVAEDDPQVEFFKVMHSKGLIQLRVIEATGAEQFAKYIYEKLNLFIQEETEGRVKVAKVEFIENNKNSSCYYEDGKTYISLQSLNHEPEEGC